MSFFFFFNATPTTEISTLSLHDALPIYRLAKLLGNAAAQFDGQVGNAPARIQDRKSTRLNSSHVEISYAVFCLKKKKLNYQHRLVGNGHVKIEDASVSSEASLCILSTLC